MTPTPVPIPNAVATPEIVVPEKAYTNGAAKKNKPPFTEVVKSFWPQMHVSVEIDRLFRFNPIVYFGLKRSSISVLSEQI